MTERLPGITVRSFTADDLPKVLEMILAIQQGEFGRYDPEHEREDLHSIATTYQAGNGGFWVAEDDRQIIGCVALKDMRGSAVTLKRMYVNADWRGRAGTAMALLKAALDHARAAGVTDVYLGTIDILLAARRFYEREGFTAISRSDLPPAIFLSPVDTHFYHRRLAN